MEQLRAVEDILQVIIPKLHKNESASEASEIARSERRRHDQSSTCRGKPLCCFKSCIKNSIIWQETERWPITVAMPIF